MSMEEDGRQIGSGAENGDNQPKLSTVRALGGLPAAQAAAAAVKIDTRPPALQGVRIPSRNENARQLVARIYEENPHLQRADLWAVTRYSELSWKFRRLNEVMDALGSVEVGGREVKGARGLVRADYEPRKLLSELRGLSDAILRLENALAITSGAKASVGVDMAKMETLAQQMQRLREGAS